MPDIDHEPSIPELLDCPACGGIGASYGVAPHVCFADSPPGQIVLGTSRTLPHEQRPENFHEDPEVPGFGVWVCETCDGNGKVDSPIAMRDDDDDEPDDGDPWPFGDVIELGLDKAKGGG